MTGTTPRPLGNVIAIDDERMKSHLDRAVRGNVEGTLNAPLNAEADRLCNAQRYERSEARRDTRAGHYERSRPRPARSQPMHDAANGRNNCQHGAPEHLFGYPRAFAVWSTIW